MTTFTDRHLPASTPDHHRPRVVPAAAVWEPGLSPAPALGRFHVRRLDPVDRASLRRCRPGVAGGSADPLQNRKSMVGETTQAYLLGGLFGLSLVLGVLAAGAGEESVPTTEYRVESPVSATR